MSSKLEYLKRYMSAEDGGPSRSRKLKVARARHDSDSDASPPRRTGSQRHDSDASPPRKRQQRRNDSDSDASPPRRRAGKRNNDSDASPPRKRQYPRQDSDSDASPPRRSIASSGKRRNDSDASPPRKRKQHRHDSEGDESPPRRPAVGGMQPARTEKQPKQHPAMSDSSKKQLGGPDVPGQTIFRDKKTGKKLDLLEEKKRKRKEEDAKAAELEKQMEWGKGLVQKQQASDNIEDMLHEMNKPLARYRDDSDLDKLQREEDREGDPMLAFMKKKKNKVDPNKPERPVWKGQFPANRYNIRPGYRWDGVDRTNGFEKKCFQMHASRKAQAQEAHMWSVEDM